MSALDADVTLRQAIAAVEVVLAQSRSASEPVTGETTMEELGFSSLDIAEVVTVLERVVGHELVAEDAAAVACVGDLVGLRRRRG